MYHMLAILAVDYFYHLLPYLSSFFCLQFITYHIYPQLFTYHISIPNIQNHSSQLAQQHLVDLNPSKWIKVEALVEHGTTVGCEPAGAGRGSAVHRGTFQELDRTNFFWRANIGTVATCYTGNSYRPSAMGNDHITVIATPSIGG